MSLTYEQQQAQIAHEANFTPEELDAIRLVVNEKQNYETASKPIRDDIKKARQNYACQFENNTTSTGRVKTFIPMTRWEVDTIVPKIFVNDKALTVVPETELSVHSAFIADKVIKHQMKEARFPTYFRNSMYDLGIDGTAVFALYWNFEKETVETEDPSVIKKTIDNIRSFFGKGKKVGSDTKVNILKDSIGFKQIDILNCFIDPTADSIQDSPSFIFRNVLTLDKVKANRLYEHTDLVRGYTTQAFNEYDSRSTQQWDIGRQTIQYERPMVNLYERWGRFPKNWLTGKKKDASQSVNGVITVADMEDGYPIILRMDTNPFDHQMKPFEEIWYQKKQGRWYGIGIAEKLIPLQRYMNKSVNRREENEDVSHAGIFKVKRGTGISAKSITSVPGGIIEVDQMTDIEQLNIQDISQLSNGTIQMINGFVERINGASEITVGSSADRSATTSLIKDRNADTRFAAVRGYVNDFLLRFFKQWMELDRQFIDKNFVIRVTGEDTELSQIDDVLGLTPEQRAAAPNFRFIDVSPEAIQGDYGLEVDIDQSIPMNKGENADRILKAIEVGTQLQIPQATLYNTYNAYVENIGLNGAKYKARPQQPQPGAGMPPGAPGAGTPPPNALQQFMSANMPNKGPMSQTNVSPSTNQIPRTAVAAPK